MEENKNNGLNGFDSVSDSAEIDAETKSEGVESSYTAPQNTYGFFPSGSYGDPNQSGKYPVFEPETPKKKKKKESRGAGIVFLSVFLSLIIGSAAGLGTAHFYLKQNTPAANHTQDPAGTPDSDKDRIDKTITINETSDSVVKAVAEKAGPSVVGIRTTAFVNNFFGGSTETPTGEGSGVIYRSDGYIITNYHVIEGAMKASNSSISVYLPSDAATAVPATVVGYSISSDLAVIKVGLTELTAIEIADSDSLAVGDYAIAIGNPGGLEFMGSVTYGIISGLNRTLTVEGIGEMSLIQTDAAINPGNSGGALVNSQGKLMGINSNKLVSTSYEGMGFAIPSNTVVEICNNIIENENSPTPYVGIILSTTYDEATLKYLGYPAGAVVQNVAEGSPAYDCGIRRGDIITEFNGQEIKSYNAFSDVVNQTKPGDIVAVKFYRSGRYYSTSLAIGANNAQ